MNLSQSKWIANFVKEKVVDKWPDSVKNLAGSWNDLPSLKEIRNTQGVDSYREDF